MDSILNRWPECVESICRGRKININILLLKHHTHSYNIFTRKEKSQISLASSSLSSS